jgi:hypothetical protein
MRPLKLADQLVGVVVPLGTLNPSGFSRLPKIRHFVAILGCDFFGYN